MRIALLQNRLLFDTEIIFITGLLTFLKAQFVASRVGAK